MSVFGSRDEDPLLQGDPLAPSSPDGSDSPDPNVPPDHETDSSESDAPGGHSVFDDREKHRVSCPKKDAAEGRLDALNASLQQGWILDRIEFRPASSSLVFVLQRPSSD